MKTFCSEAPLPGNPVDPNPIDIVFHLGRTRRFGGWGNPEWTVLHHSMLVTLLYLRSFTPNDAYHALLHDAHEAFTGDIPSPVKAAIGVEQVHSLERHLDKRIYDMLCVDPPDDGAKFRVHMCDLAALFIEGYYFAPNGTFEHLREMDWPKLMLSEQRTIIDLVLGIGLTNIAATMQGWIAT